MNTFKINYRQHEFGYLKFIAKSGSNEICFGYAFADAINKDIIEIQDSCVIQPHYIYPGIATMSYAKISYIDENDRQSLITINTYNSNGRIEIDYKLKTVNISGIIKPRIGNVLFDIVIPFEKLYRIEFEDSKHTNNYELLQERKQYLLLHNIFVPENEPLITQYLK